MSNQSDSNTHFKNMLVGAIGVVFGDIGTSPLYTIKDCLTESHYEINSVLIMGILSLIFWSITVVVTLKYVSVVLMADNNGEGGVLSLLSLNLRNATPKTKKVLFGLGAVGAALFYGDAVITPAISVLSAVEGLTVVSDTLSSYVIPLALLFWCFFLCFRKKEQSKLGCCLVQLCLFGFCCWVAWE